MRDRYDIAASRAMPATKPFTCQRRCGSGISTTQVPDWCDRCRCTECADFDMCSACADSDTMHQCLQWRILDIREVGAASPRFSDPSSRARRAAFPCRSPCGVLALPVLARNHGDLRLSTSLGSPFPCRRAPRARGCCSVASVIDARTAQVTSVQRAGAQGATMSTRGGCM